MAKTAHEPLAADPQTETGEPQLLFTVVVDNGRRMTPDQLAAINEGLGILEEEFRARPGMAKGVGISLITAGDRQKGGAAPYQAYEPVLGSHLPEVNSSFGNGTTTL